MQFVKVIGHENLKKQLIHEVNQDKVSHAQMFLGKPGYGALPMALGFVQYLFCSNKQENDSCGTCDSCRKVQELQHPDLHFSFPTVQPISKTSDGLLKEWREQVLNEPYFNLTNWIDRIDDKGRKPIIGNDESLEIIKKLSLKSYEGGYKVMVIWMAEEMNATSSNKLLKILEEPPNKTLFLLVCESQEAVLQTIISRTQIVKIPRIETDAMSLYLRDKKGLNNSTADSIAARSESDLIAVNEFLGDHVEQDVNRELFIELMRVCYKKDVIPMLDWADKMAAQSREVQKYFLKYAIHMFRQSILKNYTEEVLLKVSKEEAAFLEKFARFITGNNLLDFIQTFNESHYYIERNANPKLLFTNICFKVMRYIHVA